MDGGCNTGVHLTWPYGSDNSDLDLDDFSPSGGSSADVTRQTVSWTCKESLNQLAGECDPPHASTSPVAVPVPRNRHCHPPQRTRQESLSSVGSWQIISTTGSLRESSATSSSAGLSSAGSSSAAAALAKGSSNSVSSNVSV